MKSGKYEDEETPQRAVERVANYLLSRGVRPTLAHIEAEVEGPRHELTALLRDWAGHVVKERAIPNNERRDVPQVASLSTRERTFQGSSDSSAKKDLVKSNDQARMQNELCELEREIELVRTKLARFELGAPAGRRREVQPATIANARTRLGALEARHAEIRRNVPDIEPHAVRTTSSDK